MQKILTIIIIGLFLSGCFSIGQRTPLSVAMDYPTRIVPKCPAQAGARIPGIFRAIDRHILAGGAAEAAAMAAAQPLIDAYGVGWPNQFEAAQIYADIAMAMGPWLLAYYDIVDDQLSNDEWAALIIGTARNAMVTFENHSAFVAEVEAVPCP